jgi:hypothetical protein
MHKVYALAGWAAAYVAFGAPAEARIVCRDGFQVLNGRENSTPYCNDNYLASNAPQYGVKASDEEVRNNPGLIAGWPAATSALRITARTPTATTAAASGYFQE